MTDQALPKPEAKESPLQGIKEALVVQEQNPFETSNDRFSPGPMGYMDDPEYHRLAEFLDVAYEDRRDQKTAEKLAFLFDWAKEQTKSEDGTTNREAIRGLQRMMGINEAKSGDNLKKMVQWIRLSNTIKKAEREQGLLIDRKPEMV